MLLVLTFGVGGIALAFIAMPGDVLAKMGARGLAATVAVSLALAALAGYLDGDTPEAAFTAGMTPLFVALAIGDIATRRLPNRAIVVGSAAALAASIWGPADGYLFAVLGGLLGLTLGVVAYIGGRGAAFGAGDAKLAGLIGVTLGLRWVFPALLYGTLFGGVAALVILVSRRRNTAFAYGPYLALGAVLALFLTMSR